MVRRTTWKVFKEYETKARGRAKRTQGQIEAEWDAKDAADKAAIARSHHNVLDCIAAEQAWKEIAADDTIWANGLPNTVATATEFHDHHADAVRSHKQHLEAVDKLVRAYGDLDRMQESQHGHSRAYTQRMQADAQGKRGGIQNAINALEQAMDAQVVDQDPAGVRKVPTQWLTKDIHVRRSAAANAGHRNTGTLGAPPFGQWEALRPLQGGMATTYLWIRLNAANNISDRMVRKDAYYTIQQWFDVRNWAGFLEDEGQREPLELHCHGEMSRIPGASVVAPRTLLNNPSIRMLQDTTLRSYRLYVSWCPHGDLHSVINHHRHNQTAVPEQFIWYVARNLAQVALAMEQGFLPPAVAPVAGAGWEEIVHRDLKPGNIFLDAADPNFFPNYPQPRVGDWGLAIRTTPNDTGNPHWYQDKGTRGFYPPEQRAFVDQATLQPLGPRMLAHTNIWGLGIILYSLMTRATLPPDCSWHGDPSNDFFRYFRAARHNNYVPYSTQLRDTMLSCLHPDPGNRPTPAALLAYVDNVIQGNVPGLPALSMAAHPITAYEAGRNRVDFGADTYHIGLARAMVPP